MQAVPSLRTPALDDAMPFYDQVRTAAFAQMLAHCEAGLTSANNQGLDVLDRHGLSVSLQK